MYTEKQLEHVEPTTLFATPRKWEEVKVLQVATTKLWQEHTARIARSKYVALHGEADEDRPNKWFIDQAQGPNPTTTANYLRRGAHAFSFASATGADVWDKLAERVGSLAAWYTGRAALHFFLLKAMRDAKSVIDRALQEPVQTLLFRHGCSYPFAPITRDLMASVTRKRRWPRWHTSPRRHSGDLPGGLDALPQASSCGDGRDCYFMRRSFSKASWPPRVAWTPSPVAF